MHYERENWMSLSKNSNDQNTTISHNNYHKNKFSLSTYATPITIFFLGGEGGYFPPQNQPWINPAMCLGGGCHFKIGNYQLLHNI